jgi:uncharacterized membrane protein (UPF0127 family)
MACKRNVVFALLLLPAAVFAFGAGESEPQKLAEQPVVIQKQDGGKISMTCQIARTEKQNEVGLMFVKKLTDGHGMLFVYDRDQILHFWMKNTLIPLSIAFIGADGVINEINDMRAESLSDVQSKQSARYALEAPLGWFTRAGVVEGDRMLWNPN